MSKNTKINFKMTEKEVKVLGNLLFYFEDFQKTKKENKKDWLEKLFCYIAWNFMRIRIKFSKNLENVI